MCGDIRRFWFCLAAVGWGQSVEVGVIGRVPVTEAYETGDWFIPALLQTMAMRVQRHGGIPSGRSSGFRYHTASVAAGALYTRSIENSWEFPVLAAYRLPGHLPGTPYVAAGPSFRATTNVSLTGHETYPGGYTPNVSPSTSPYALVDRRSKVGFAAGLGGEAKAGRLRIRPELRYTRWAASTNALGVSNVLQSNQNQVEFLLSFGIRMR